MKLTRLLPILVICIVSAHAQTAPSHAAFRGSLLRFQKDSVGWENTLAKLKVEELPVSYGQGKVIEDNISLALKELDFARTLVAQILRTERLSDEINLLVTVQSFQTQLEEISSLLTDTPNNTATANKVQAWSDPLMGLAAGAVNMLYKDVFTYVTFHADEIEIKASR